MKIVQVTRQFYPSVGGIETVIWHLSQHLRSAGHHVHVITLNRLFERERDKLPPEEEVDGILVRRIPCWGPRQYTIAPGVLRHVREYDLIHLHSSDFLLDYLAWTKPIHGKPIVLSSHGIFFHTTFARTFKQVYFQTVTRLDLRRVSAVMCDSHHDLELLGSIVPAARLHPLPNGIEYDRLAGLDVHGRDPDLLISVGRLQASKRCDRLLRAFAGVVQGRPTARLVLIGPDWGVLSSLKELSARLNITEQVEFAGQVSDTELLSYLSRASVWLSASAYEGFGIALLEAMAAGCIPIVQPLPSFRQLLTENTAGVFVDFDRPDQASQVILKSLDLSPQERERMVAHARGQAAQFSWEAIVHQVQRIYAQALEADGPRVLSPFRKHGSPK